jgi:hypothetical protein
MNFELPTPDISWDLDRLDTDLPIEVLSQAPSPADTMAPVTPLPTTSTPVTANPTTLAPSSSQASSINGSSTSTSSSKDRTYYSCSPLWSENSQPTSTVRIAYYFQVQILSDEDIAMLLPTIESRFQSSLGEYLKTNTVYDENRCEGYYVEDFRRRNLKDAHTRRLFSHKERHAAKEISTTIIGISSVMDMEVDETQSCVPKNEQCYIVHGELDAAFIGENEAGVKTSVSRVVEEEMGGDSTYEIKYLGTQYQPEDSRSAIDQSIDGVVANRQDTSSDRSNGGLFLSPLGIGILAILGSTFFIACYVLFVKSDGAEKVKKTLEHRKEKKMSKKNALCEEDDEKRTDDQDYCYDLQSITIDCDSEMESEDGVEVKHTMRAPVRAIRHETESTHDSEKTRKISNTTDDPVVFAFAYEDDDDESADCQSSKISSSQVLLPTSSTAIPPKSTNGGGIPLVDRFPSTRAKSKSMAHHKQADESCAIYTLPPISESLSPPMNDTPHVSHRPITPPDAPGRVETGDWEV